MQKHYLSAYGGLTSMFYQCFIAGLISLPFITTAPNHIATDHWLLLIILATIFTALPHSLFTNSLRYLKAKSVGLIASLQPLYGALFAYLILQEQPTAMTIVGGGIILGAAIYETYSV